MKAITREEQYLQDMIGAGLTPAPKNRKELYLSALAKKVNEIEEKIGHGGGLPDPSEYDDGTVLVKVGNEWKAQSGYGYEGEPAFEPIEWDGNTEGRAAATIDGSPFMYKVSDDLLTANDLVVSNIECGGQSMTITEEYVEVFDDAVIALYVFSGKAGIYDSSDLGVSFSVPEDGTYFYNADGVSISSLTAPTVHTIDPKFIPQSGTGDAPFWVTFYGEYDEDDEFIPLCEQTFEEIAEVISKGRQILVRYKGGADDPSTLYATRVWHSIESGDEYVAGTFISLASEGWLQWKEFSITPNGVTLDYKWFTVAPSED